MGIKKGEIGVRGNGNKREKWGIGWQWGVKGHHGEKGAADGE